MGSIRSLLLASALLGSGLCAAPEASAQASATSGVLELSVRSAEDTRPLPGARVTLEGLGISGITDQSGFIRIVGIPIGSWVVEASYLGYQTTAEYLSFTAGRETRVQFRMPIQPIELREVRVRGVMDLLIRRGFYQRLDAGFGTFLTREDIQETRPQYVSDILRRQPGVRVVGSPPRSSVTLRRGGDDCPLQVFLDGALTSRFSVDDLVPDDIAGLELYRGSSVVPPEYNRGTARCGVLLVWTRID